MDGVQDLVSSFLSSEGTATRHKCALQFVTFGGVGLHGAP